MRCRLPKRRWWNPIPCRSVQDVAAFKELCLDTANDDPAVGRFWAGLAGLEHHCSADDPAGDLAGDQEGMGIAVCVVSEPKTIKNRVHLDVSVNSIDEVTTRGGTVLAEHELWTVCQDPEGNELCAFVRAGDMPAYKVFEIVVDCVDPEAIATWWAEAFGVPVQNEGQPWWWISGVDGFPTAGSWFGMVFAPVPEPKTVKNRMHWDVFGDRADFLARGATHLWDGEQWTVLADPEGNEFCVFPPR